VSGARHGRPDEIGPILCATAGRRSCSERATCASATSGPIISRATTAEIPGCITGLDDEVTVLFAVLVVAVPECVLGWILIGPRK
jgi:hypothetical protein